MEFSDFAPAAVYMASRGMIAPRGEGAVVEDVLVRFSGDRVLIQGEDEQSTVVNAYPVHGIVETTTDLQPVKSALGSPR